MTSPADPPSTAEREAITAAGLDATFAAHPDDVLQALRNARALRSRLVRSRDPAHEPATVFRLPVAP
jgi:hypothetical protein